MKVEQDRERKKMNEELHIRTNDRGGFGWYLWTFAVIVGFVLVFFSSGCGTAGKAYRIIDPRGIDKKKLSQAPFQRSPKYKIPYLKTKGVDHSIKRWGEIIDQQYEEYATCIKKKFKKNSNVQKVQNRRVVIVRDGKFKCRYHKGRCSGEYDSKLKSIFVARKDIGKKGLVPSLKHEWGHVDGIIEPKHANLDEVKKCTRY